MNRFILRGLILMFIFFSVSGVVGAHSEEAAVCIRTYNTIVIDGKLDDWTRRINNNDWLGRLDVKKGAVVKWIKAPPNYINIITSNIEQGEILDNLDYQMTFYTMWDEDNLYFAAVVTDDEIVAENKGGDIWKDDLIEIWLDTRHDAITEKMIQDDEYQIGFSPGSYPRDRAVGWVWRNPEPEPVIEKLKIASQLTEKGYIIEASVPFRVLKGLKPPENGRVIGFNVSGVDKDIEGAWAHIVWSGRLHSNPAEFGYLYFVDDPIDLFKSDL